MPNAIAVRIIKPAATYPIDNLGRLKISDSVPRAPVGCVPAAGVIRRVTVRSEPFARGSAWVDSRATIISAAVWYRASDSLARAFKVIRSRLDETLQFNFDGGRGSCRT